MSSQRNAIVLLAGAMSSLVDIHFQGHAPGTSGYALAQSAQDQISKALSLLPDEDGSATLTSDRLDQVAPSANPGTPGSPEQAASVAASSQLGGGVAYAPKRAADGSPIQPPSPGDDLKVDSRGTALAADGTPIPAPTAEVVPGTAAVQPAPLPLPLEPTPGPSAAPTGDGTPQPVVTEADVAADAAVAEALATPLDPATGKPQEPQPLDADGQPILPPAEPSVPPTA